ncbi:hypothetical protein BpHYR1_006249 [Brachionus plicatilis]|uniref:Uncharacterized protein n=1 Tax=Brachionus plicatilis TaxID=10195 RepID=A0A3M7SZ46_BRAPC|nr:hypothetical protein BpHYR1_006249 [Brachionus plicatilis]
MLKLFSLNAFACETRRAVAERIEALTDSDIKNEAKRLWARNGTNKQRVSKMDRELAKASLISKIRTEENQKKDLDFLERYSSNANY